MTTEQSADEEAAMQQYLAAMEVTEGEEQKHLVEELEKGLGDQQAEEKEETDVPMEVREMLGEKLSTEEEASREDVQQQTQPVEEEKQPGMEEAAAREEAEVPQVQQVPETKQVIPAGQVEEEEKEAEPTAPPEEKDESVRVFAEGQQQSQEEIDEQLRAAAMGKRLDEQHIEEQAAASKEQQEEQVSKQEAVTAILIEERIAKNIGEMVGAEPEEPLSFAEDTVSMEEVEQLPEVDDAEVEEMLEEMMESVFQAPTPPPTKESPMLPSKHPGKHPGLGMEIPKTSTPSLILPMQPGVYTPPSQRGLKTRVV